MNIGELGERRNGSAHPTDAERRNGEIPCVAIIDMDSRQCRLVHGILQRAGYQVIQTNGNLDIWDIIYRKPALIILDRELAENGGEFELNNIRKFSSLPIIVMDNDYNEDRLSDMLRERGADDYLVKGKFSDAELVAKVGAILRRKRYTPEDTRPAIFENGELTINFAQHLVSIQDREINLTPTEYKLLAHLAKNLGKIVPIEDILRAVWDPGYKNALHLVRVHIARLRKKLGMHPGTNGSRESGKFEFLTTHEAGYRMPNLNQPKTSGTITMNPAPILPRTE